MRYQYRYDYGVSEGRTGELALLAHIIKAALKDLRSYPPYSSRQFLENTEEMRFLCSDGLMSLLRLCGVQDPHGFIEQVIQHG